MNIGNISPEVIRQLREKYATGISAPKKVKKAKKAVGKKKTVGRRQGQPVAAKSPSTGRKGINRQAGINLDGFRRLNPSAGINLDDLMLDIGGEGGGGGNYYRGENPVSTPPTPPTPSVDPSVREKLKDLFGDADAIKTSFPQYLNLTGENPEAGASRGRPYKGNPFDGSGDIPPQFLTNSGFVMDPEERARISGGGIGDIPSRANSGDDGSFNVDFAMSQEARARMAAIEASDLYPEIQNMNRQLNQMRDQQGSPEYKQLESRLFALQNQAASAPGIPPGSMASIPTPVGNRFGTPEGPQPGTGVGDGQQPAPPKAPAPPINIMGPSFDPNERKEYEEKIRSQMSLMPGQNIISQNPVTMNPLSAVPQTQFGGYGAQMPMEALNPYAGMGAANKKVDFCPDYVDAPPKTT